MIYDAPISNEKRRLTDKDEENEHRSRFLSLKYVLNFSTYNLSHIWYLQIHTVWIFTSATKEHLISRPSGELEISLWAYLTDN